MFKKSIIICLLVSSFLLNSCQGKLRDLASNSGNNDNYKALINTEKIADNVTLNPVMGQTIYVPTYSYIYYGNQGKIYNLTVTISLHNTDQQNSIILKSVKYYNAKGELIEDYVSQPAKLNALASTDIYIDELDTRGGVGDKFIIEWVAENQVSKPVVESVMIGASGTQGISFVSQGKVVKDWND